MKRMQRVGSYLTKYADALVFDHFQEEYLKREGIYEYMKEVPIPVSAQDVVESHKTGGFHVINVARNMIRIIGINPEFPYVEQYLRYIRKYFNENVVEAVIRDGEERARQEQTEEALIYFRAALVMDPKQKYALFDYGLACRQLAENNEGASDEAYRGAMKADSIEAFEEVSGLYPEFAPPYYYLGYIYLNMGLYMKARLTFQMFLKLSESVSMDPQVLAQQRKEAAERVDQLKEPTKIESGINHVLAGRPELGAKILAPYVDGDYDLWWPLHYYLGVAYVEMGRMEDAADRFLRVLQLNPSHRETMKELAEIYEAKGDQTMSEKYRRKAELLSQ